MGIYKKILFAPKGAFEDSLFKNKKPSLLKLPLFMMAAIGTFDIAYLFDDILPKESRFLGFISAAIISIGVVFLIIGLIVPWVIRLFGKIWKGKATMRQLVNVCSASYTPFILILVYQISMFALNQDTTSAGINSSVSYIIWLWSLSLSIIGVAKVQGFSYGMALLNILMSYIPFVLVGVLRS